MVTTIIRFACICRAAGIPVSPAEIIDAVDQLEWIDPNEERQFTTVPKDNFLKNQRDTDTFAKINELFFHRLPNMTSPTGRDHHRREKHGIWREAERLSAGVTGRPLFLTPRESI